MILPTIYTTCVSREASLFQALTATDRLSDLLPVLHHHAVSAVEGRSSIIFQFARSGDTLQATSAFGVDRLPPDPWPARLIPEALFRDEKPLFVADISRVVRGAHRVSRHPAGPAHPAGADAEPARGAGRRMREAAVTTADARGRLGRARLRARARSRARERRDRSADPSSESCCTLLARRLLDDAVCGAGNVLHRRESPVRRRSHVGLAPRSARPDGRPRLPLPMSSIWRRIGASRRPMRSRPPRSRCAASAPR